MRSTFLTFCLVVVVAVAAGPARGDSGYMEYVGSSGTANYNVATNWNELVLSDPNDPNSRLVLADPPINRVPANNTYPLTEDVAYIRNGATVTVVDTVPMIAAISVGEAGDVTKDTGGTIQPRPGSTLEVKSGGLVKLVGVEGSGYPTNTSGTVGASYDGTLNISGGQFSAYNHLYIGTNGAVNPGGEVPYQGTGYLNVSSGEFNMSWGGSVLYIGAGRVSDTTGKRVEGIATYSGGVVNMEVDSATMVGFDGGRGSLTVYDADPNTPTHVYGPEATLLVGSAGTFGNPPGGTGWGWYERSEGTYIQNAGTVVVDQVIVGSQHADGLFILNGGSFRTEADGECRVGVGAGRTYGPTAYLSTGYGTLIINDGYFVSQNSRTKFIVGRAGWNTGAENFGPGHGVFTINGGIADFRREGEELRNCLEIGHSCRTDAINESTAYGELNVLGGSLLTNLRLMVAKNEGSTGVFHVGKDGYVLLGWLAFWEATYEDPNVPHQTPGTAKMIVDVTGTGHSVVNLDQDMWLQGTLDVQTYGWRPREADKFMIINGNSYLTEIYEDFDAFTSNITNGLPPDPNDPNETLSAFLGTGVPGNLTTPDPNAGYWVTFQGYTAGDCLGDHDVDTGDLALLGGNWMATSGMTWADGDFNDDGKVDTGDLALMGGNWMWSLSSPPEGAAIPEPATAALLALGGAVMIRRKRR